MRRRSDVSRLLASGFAIALAAMLLATATKIPASGNDSYEVWAIDQANSPGLPYGGTLYIWDGHDLENKRRARTVVPDQCGHMAPVDVEADVVQDVHGTEALVDAPHRHQRGDGRLVAHRVS